MSELKAESLDEGDEGVQVGESAGDLGDLELSSAVQEVSTISSVEEMTTHPSLSTLHASLAILTQSVPIKLKQQTTASTIAPPCLPPGSGTLEHSASTTHPSLETRSKEMTLSSLELLERVRARTASPQPKSATRELGERVEESELEMMVRGWTGQPAACERNPA